MTEPVSPSVTFEALGLPAELLAALNTLGYKDPTPVQQQAIPPLLEGRDVLGQAATGTGKTAAFSLPMLARLQPGKRKMFETSALVLVPTRELALQVTEAVRKYGQAMGVSAVAVYGGEPITNQLKFLKRGVDVVIATPGRALDHLERKSLKLDQVQMVVLDEADEMLDMGFEEDLKKILGALPATKQTALFSATMPPRIQKIAERHLKQPVRVSIRREKPAAGATPRVRQVAYVVPRPHKTAALVRVLQAEGAVSALVFCRTRADVDELSAVMPEKGLSAEALHGGLDQSQRDRVMRRFKAGTTRLLIATDVAARGLDIDHLSLVVNYEPPTSPEVYVHRIGRTGRAGREGLAITLFEPGQVKLIRGLEGASGGKLVVTPVPDAKQLVGRRLDKTKNAVLEQAKAGASDELKAWIAEQGVDAVELAAAAMALLDKERAEREPIDEGDIPAARSQGGKFDRPARLPDGRHARFGRDQRAGADEAAVEQARHAAPAEVETSAPAPRPSRAAAARSTDEAPAARPSRASAARSTEEASPRPSRASHARADDDAPAARPSRASHARAPDDTGPRQIRGGDEPFEQPAPQARQTRDARGRPFGDRPQRPRNFDRPGAPAPRPSRGTPDGQFRTDPRDEQRPRFNDRRPADRGPSRGGGNDANKVALFVGAGNAAGIRPADLVGAIANEAGIDSKLIGPIQVKDLYSLVAVPASKAEAVITALRNTKLRGRKVQVRRER